MSTGLISAATTMNRQQDLLLLEHVGTVLEQLGAQSVFVVADGEAYMASGGGGAAAVGAGGAGGVDVHQGHESARGVGGAGGGGGDAAGAA